MKIVPICTECKEPFTRQECLEGWNMTGFCHPCGQHTKLCTDNHHMWPCARLYGHSGSHITERGCEFVDDKSLGYTPIPEMLDIKVIDETVSPDRISIKPISNET